MYPNLLLPTRLKTLAVSSGQSACWPAVLPHATRPMFDRAHNLLLHASSSPTSFLTVTGRAYHVCGSWRCCSALPCRRCRRQPVHLGPQ